MLYDWPGNVRELVSAVERAVADAYNEPTLYPKHLPIDIRVKIARSSVRKEPAGGDPPKALRQAAPAASRPWRP